MTARAVFAHPDRLRQFRHRRGDGRRPRGATQSLHAAVAGYEGSTEPLYRADCRAALEGVLASAWRCASWASGSGACGDAWTLPEIDGVHLGRLERLVAALPPELRTDDDWAAAGGGSVGSRAPEPWSGPAAEPGARRPPPCSSARSMSAAGCSSSPMVREGRAHAGRGARPRRPRPVGSRRDRRRGQRRRHRRWIEPRPGDRRGSAPKRRRWSRRAAPSSPRSVERWVAGRESG